MPKKEGKRGTRPASAPAKKLRGILARNVELLIDRDYPANRYSTESARLQKVATDAGVSWSSVQRALNPNVGNTLDVLADLAGLFTIKPHELLDPELADRLAEAIEESAKKPGSQGNPS
jgi:hypothetical protein